MEYCGMTLVSRWRGVNISTAEWIFVNYAVIYTILLWISSGSSWKRKSVQFSGKKQSHSVDKCILAYFVRNQLHPVCNWPRKICTETLCSMLRSWKALKLRPAVRRKFWIHREIVQLVLRSTDMRSCDILINSLFQAPRWWWKVVH